MHREVPPLLCSRSLFSAAYVWLRSNDRSALKRYVSGMKRRMALANRRRTGAHGADELAGRRFRTWPPSASRSPCPPSAPRQPWCGSRGPPTCCFACHAILRALNRFAQANKNRQSWHKSKQNSIGKIYLGNRRARLCRHLRVDGLFLRCCPTVRARAGGGDTGALRFQFEPARRQE